MVDVLTLQDHCLAGFCFEGGDGIGDGFCLIHKTYLIYCTFKFLKLYLRIGYFYDFFGTGK